MGEASKDTQRALAAAKEILGSRDPEKDASGILVTLDHTIATVLLALYPDKPAMASGMLNEGVLPGVEERLALYNSKR